MVGPSQYLKVAIAIQIPARSTLLFLEILLSGRALTPEPLKDPWHALYDELLEQSTLMEPEHLRHRIFKRNTMRSWGLECLPLNP